MKKTLIQLIVIFVLGYVLRIYFLNNQALTFGYDQARDALVTQEIIGGDLKIIGPSASTPGLYHGVLYNYSLIPAYLFGKNPLNAAYWISFLNSLTIFTVFYLTWLLTKKESAAFLSAFIFAISFEATQYASWLSNPTLGVLTVPLIYLGVWVWISENKKWGAILTGLALGLSVQAEIFLLYQFIPVLIWLIVGRKSVTKVSLFKFISTFILAVSSMILVEFKFGFKSIGGILNLATTQDNIVASRGFGDFIILYFNQLGKVFANNIYPGNVGYAGMFVMFLVIISLLSWKKQKISWQPFLATWIFSHLTVVSVGGTSTPFLLVGIGVGVCILVGINLSNWWLSGKKILVSIAISIIVFGNLSFIYKENIKGQTIFAIQKDMLLRKQIEAINYIYSQSEGKPFAINTLTSPLWINIVWAYLFEWYGKDTYGYVPEFNGQDQIGQLISLPKNSTNTKNYFLIIEPMGGIPTRYLGDVIGEADSMSKLIEEKSFGELIVQKRLKI